MDRTARRRVPGNNATEPNQMTQGNQPAGDHASTQERMFDELLLDISATLDVGEAFDQALEAGCQVLGFDAAVAVLWQESLGVVMATRGLPPDLELSGSLVTKSESIAGRLFAEKRLVELKNYSKHAEAYPPLRPLNFALGVGVPVFSEGKIVATLTFMSGSPVQLSERNKYQINKLARQLGVSIFNAKLFQELEGKKRQVQEVNKYLELLLSSTLEVIVNVDKSGKVTYWNKAAERTLGYTMEEIAGEGLPLHEGKSVEVFEKLFGGARNGESFKGARILFRTKNNKKLLLKLTVTPVFDEEGKVASILVIGRDITKTRKLEMQVTKSKELLQEKESLLEDTKRRLQAVQEKLIQAEKLSTIVDLANGISHEINNPLMGILNHAQLLKEDVERIEDEDARADFQESLDEIVEACEKIEGVTRNLLILSRFEKYERYHPVRLEDVVEAVLRKASEKFRERGVALRKEFTPSGESFPTIMGRFELLEHCVKNLLDASIAGLSGGDATTEAANFANSTASLATATNGDSGSKEIIIRMYDKLINLEPFVVLEVEDNGPPIPEHLLPKVFDPFPKASFRFTKGLGMSIVLSVVKNHGGEITVQNLPRGVLFKIKLPVLNSGGAKN
ncbi:MAG: hypothetical protein Kow0069_23420 [Promethearchaeota archaeon]